MAYQKTARQVQKQYERLKAKEEWLKTHPPVQKATVDRRARRMVIYTSYLITAGTATPPATTTSQDFTVQASEKAIRFFSKASGDLDASEFVKLGLLEVAKDKGSKPPRGPKFWTPAKVHAMLGTATPIVGKTSWGTRTIKNYPATSGTNQSFYSCPISTTDSLATYEKISLKADAIYAAIKSNLGAGDGAKYARFYLSPEMFNTQYQ